MKTANTRNLTYFERQKTTSDVGVVIGINNIVKLVGGGGSRRERYSPHATNALNQKK